jgi:hypothetical protein
MDMELKAKVCSLCDCYYIASGVVACPHCGADHTYQMLEEEEL